MQESDFGIFWTDIKKNMYSCMDIWMGSQGPGTRDLSEPEEVRTAG
jgi:hypothetical protein